MKPFASCIPLAVLVLASGMAFAADASPRRIENFNLDWKFAKGAQAGAETAGFNDSAWEPVRLPHDWAIQGPYYSTAFIAKGIEVALIVLLAVDFVRADGNPVVKVRSELAAALAWVGARRASAGAAA